MFLSVFMKTPSLFHHVPWSRCTNFARSYIQYSKMLHIEILKPRTEHGLGQKKLLTAHNLNQTPCLEKTMLASHTSELANTQPDLFGLSKLFHCDSRVPRVISISFSKIYLKPPAQLSEVLTGEYITSTLGSKKATEVSFQPKHKLFVILWAN